MSRARWNRASHGLLASGLSPLDDADSYFALLDRLRQELQPEGEIERFYVQRIALGIVRVTRASRLEAEAIAGALFPETRSRSKSEQELEQQFDKMGLSTSIIKPGFNPQLRTEAVASLSECLARYEKGHERSLIKAIEQLERRQRARNADRSASSSAVSEPATPAVAVPDSLRMEKRSNADVQLTVVTTPEAVKTGQEPDS